MSSWFSRNFGSFGNVAAEIRQRVIEEPYFGKVVTPRVSSITIGSPGEKSPGEGLGWFDRSFEADPARQADSPGRDIHGNERGMER